MSNSTRTLAGNQEVGDQPPSRGMVVQEIPLDEIFYCEGPRRKVDRDRVNQLKESIREIGLLHPPGVKPSKEIVYGRNRYEACKQLGWETLPVVIVDTDDLRLELAEIDENIQRKQLTKAEEMQALARRKEIYETLHPETKQGAAPGKAGGGKKAKSDTMSSFAADTAAATGKSKRTIERDVATANTIPTDVQEKIAGLAIANNKSQLKKLGKLPEEMQREIAKHLADGGLSSTPDTFCSCGGFLFEEGECLNCSTAVGAGDDEHTDARIDDRDDAPDVQHVDDQQPAPLDLKTKLAHLTEVGSDQGDGCQKNRTPSALIEDILQGIDRWIAHLELNGRPSEYHVTRGLRSAKEARKFINGGWEHLVRTSDPLITAHVPDPRQDDRERSQ